MRDTARMKIKASYSQRFLMQMLWVILAIVAPCFHFVAGIVPLLFPGTGIKIVGIFHNKILILDGKLIRQEVNECMELDISGAKIFFTLPIDLPVLGLLRISETMVVSWIVMILITGLCIWLTHDLKKKTFPNGRLWQNFW